MDYRPASARRADPSRPAEPCRRRGERRRRYRGRLPTSTRRKMISSVSYACARVRLCSISERGSARPLSQSDVAQSAPGRRRISLRPLRSPRPIRLPRAVDGSPSPPGRPRLAVGKALAALSNLPLALAELAALASLSAVGTLIEQNESAEYYATLYPTDDSRGRVLGFLTGDLIVATGLDHIYTAPW